MLHLNMKTAMGFRLIITLLLLASLQSPAQTMLKEGQKILFVGNSKVGSEGGLHHHFRRTLARMDTPVQVETDWIAMYGSPTLASMLTDELIDRIQNGDDDLVIVQSGTIEDLNTFAQLVTDHDKNMVVYGVWADNPFLSDSPPHQSYSEQVLQQYQELKKFEQEHHIPVAPCGLAFYNLLSRQPQFPGLRADYLFTPGGSVQNDLGTLVNVSMLYAVLSGQTPQGLPVWDPYPQSLVEEIQSRAYEVFQQWQKDRIDLEPFQEPPPAVTSSHPDLQQTPEWSPLLKPLTEIFYVGNSYIGTEGGLENHFPRLLKEIGSPYQPKTQSQIFWGQGLQRMFTEGVKEQIRNGNQELIVVTSGPREYLDSMYGEISAADKQMVVHMTWGRNPTLGGMENFREGTRRIVSATREFEKETGVPAVPCGLIYYDLVKNPPVIDGISLRLDWVFMEENIHQNHLGTMVNAAAHYAIMTGQSPVGLPMWDPYPESLVLALQERVWEVVKQWKSGVVDIE